MTQKTYREACNWASSLLTEKQTKSPAFEAELLLRKSANIERYKLFMCWDEPMVESTLLKYEKWINQRGEHVPVQYITNEQEFYGRLFYVDNRVLIPRPETELLVEQALNRLQELRNEEAISILDIGTGSGAISLTLAFELSDTDDKAAKPSKANCKTITIDGLDISAAALEVAKINAQNLAAQSKLHPYIKQRWMHGDTWPTEDAYNGKPQYNMILSNPPYVDWSDYSTMDREVKDFEPELALFAADEGLAIYKKIISEAHQYLIVGGWIGFEIGYQQATAIQQLLRANKFQNIETYRDLAGHQRVIFAQRCE